MTSTRGWPRTTGPRASSSSRSRRWSPPWESSRTSSRRRKSWWRTCKPEKPCNNHPRDSFRIAFFPPNSLWPKSSFGMFIYIQTQQTIISISSSQLPVTVSRPKPSSSQQSLVLTNNACNKTCICSLLQKSNHRGRQDLLNHIASELFLPYYENKNEHISFYHPKKFHTNTVHSFYDQFHADP